MPLIGFQDDNGVQIRFEDCWKRERFAGFPVEVLFRIYLEYASNARPDGLSATSLLGCPRKTVLERQQDYYENPRFMYARFRGTMIHSILEGTNQLYRDGEVMSERRFFRKVPRTDVVLSGKIDKYLIHSQTLEDYKTIDEDKVPKLVKELPEDYIKQANIYAWILEGNGYPVKRIKIHFFSWKTVYTTGDTCLIGTKWTDPRWEKIAECPLNTMAQTEDYIVHRVKDIVRQDLPSVVGPDKRWMCIACPFKPVCWPQGLLR